MKRIFPSLIAADLVNLQRDIERLDPFCPGYHLDIMDNHFVPNLTWGPAFVKAIASVTRRTLWAHIMADRPLDWVDMLKLSLPSGSIFTFHIETIGENINIIKRIRELGWLPGVALRPKSNVDEIFPLLNSLHQVLLMSVEPGFSDQEFLKDTIGKLETLVGYRQTSKLDFKIALDGGINATNIGMLAKKGVDDFAVAAGIFKQADAVKALKDLTTLITT